MATKPNDDNSLSHTRWNCKYHIVFIPKYRRKEFLRKAVQERKEKSRNGRDSADLTGFDAVFS